MKEEADPSKKIRSYPARAIKNRTKKTKKKEEESGPQLAAPGSLTRTKALLLAALRVWDLKHPHLDD